MKDYLESYEIEKTKTHAIGLPERYVNSTISTNTSNLSTNVLLMVLK